MTLEGWVCPNCFDVLCSSDDSTKYLCTACRSDYPRLGRVPLLLRDAESRVQASLVAAQLYCRRLLENEDRCRALLQSDEKSYRWSYVEKLGKALHDMRSLPEEFSAWAVDILTRTNAALPASNLAPTASQYGFQNLLYLRTDWARTSEGERQIQIIFQGICASLQTGRTTLNNVLVIGAGAGRLLYELTNVSEKVYGIDLSLPYAFIFDKLHSESISFTEACFHMPMSAETAIQSHTAYIDSAASVDKVYYAAADMSRLPMPNNSLDAVISSYCTDVLPIDTWLPEVCRTLRPGGRFIHFGPLAYRTINPEFALMPEEIVAYLERNGFVIERNEWSSMEFMRSPHVGLLQVHRIWNISARFEGG